MFYGKALKRMLSVILAAVMLLGLATPALATEGEKSNVTLRRVNGNAVSADLGLARPNRPQEDVIAPNQAVRVSIVVDGKSTLDAGYSLDNVADNAAAMTYRAGLKKQQISVAQAISAQALGGKKLDVVWNLTLAANIISANVPYGKLDAIRAVPGVANVVVERQYDVPTTVREADEPNMGTSGAMIGTTPVHAAGYTGAGTRIAVIDTGTDTDHKSFNSAAFEAAIVEDYAAKLEDPEAEPTFEEAAEFFGLLTSGDLARLAGELHATELCDEATADTLYVSSKLPFGFNYVDVDLDITHDNDDQGEHGSHVAGIATANRLIEVGEDQFEDALTEVLTQGVAPDAQLITMKVFGKDGGAYDSDYMVAIEDAIVLGCDVVNLSLGSSSAGNTISETYENIMDDLTRHGLVASISAGNSGSWADHTVAGEMAGLPYLYLDDVSLDTVGSPGSFTNSLAVASADNVGSTGNGFEVDGKSYLVTDTSSDDNTAAPFTSLDTSEDGSGTEYAYVFTTGLGSTEEIEALGEGVLEGKIFICQRGTITFIEKAENAVAGGAVATIIYNNTAGTINMDLSDYTKTAPAVSITNADGLSILAASTPVPNDADVPLYYTGTLTVSQGTIQSAPEEYNPYFNTMSDFSSWGVPGDLSLKPEITAPGGNIYSVNGQIPGGEAYENMSGTSMASPQVAGMVALVSQYIKEEGLAEGKDAAFTRQLAQSLLMSTAVPQYEVLADEEGNAYPAYYSVMKQGAGLANVGAAIGAASYITVDGQPDGKVKVELGEDAKRSGKYSFTFTLHDLSGEGGTYLLGGDMFTQDAFSGLGLMMNTSTMDLIADVTFSGAAVSAVTDEDGTAFLATVPAGGAAKVNVTMSIDAEYKAYLDEYYTSGAYVEAFVTADELLEDGGWGTSHSIPVLGFYGNWTDGSMYDRASYLGTVYEFDEVYPYVYDPDEYLNMETNYLVANAPASGGEYIFGGNPFADLFFDLGEWYYADQSSDEYYYETYLPERNAISSIPGNVISEYAFSPIRNAAGSLLRVVDQETDEVYLAKELGGVDGAYYYDGSGEWLNYAYTAPISWDVTDAEGNPLSDGTKLEVQLILAPEYYGEKVTDENGETGYTFDWDALLDGSLRNGELGQGAFLTTSMTVDNQAPIIAEAVADPESKTLSVATYDDQYIAAVIVYNADGTRIITAQSPDQQFPGTNTEIVLDMDGVYGTKFMVEVYDYALNKTTYRATTDAPFNDLELEGSVLLFDELGAWNVVEVGEEPAANYLVDSPDPYLAAATDAAGYVFLNDLYGDIYMATAQDIDVMTMVSKPGIVFDDMAYNAQDSLIYGLVSEEDGPWLYSVDPTSGAVTRVGKIGMNDATTLACDDEGNFYAIDEYDGVLYTFTTDGLAAPASVTVVTDVSDFDVGQSLAWSDGILYWAQYAEGDDSARLIAFNLAESPVASTVVCPLDGPTVAMVVPSFPEEEPEWAAPTEGVDAVAVEPTETTVLVGESVQLTAFVTPWTLTDKSVTWTSSNTSVATVSSDGVVTALKAGTATITAASTLDPTKTATCVITVEVLPYTVQGILQDDNGNVRLFTWDVGNDRTYTPLATDDLSKLTKFGYASIAKAGERDLLYIMDGAKYNVYQFNTAGRMVEPDPVESEGFPLWDMTYSTYYGSDEDPLIFGVAFDTVYFPVDAENYDFIDDEFSGDLALCGASYLVGITSAGQYSLPGMAEDGTDLDCELLYAMDNVGGLWTFYYHLTDEEEGATMDWDYLGVVPGLERANISDLSGSGDYSLGGASLVLASDNEALFFTYYDKAANTSLLYVLRNDGDDTSWAAQKVGTFGNDVWPASLYAAEPGSVKPVKPSRPVYPTEPVETEEPVIEITENEDGSITTTVTEPDGTVTETTEKPDGSKVEKVTTPDEGVEVTVTDAEGEVVAEVNIPATISEPEKRFEDVPEGHWADEAIHTIAALGVVNGVGNNKYDMESDVTRGALAAILYRLSNKPTAGELTFDDVDDDAYYAEGVAWAAKVGVVEGYDDVTFKPKWVITREQLALMLMRYAKLLAMDTTADTAVLESFVDGATTHDWAADGVAWCVQTGILQGKDDSKLDPTDSVTRAQVAVMLNRFIGLL